jgi:hypothetical protein
MSAAGSDGVVPSLTEAGGGAFGDAFGDGDGDRGASHLAPSGGPQSFLLPACIIVQQQDHMAALHVDIAPTSCRHGVEN